MDIQNCLNKACLALCHWTTYNRIIMPDYHINEGSIVVECAKLIRSIDRTNDLKFKFEKSYNKIGTELDFEVIMSNLNTDGAADIYITGAEKAIVIEVKKDYMLDKKQSEKIPKEVIWDLKKLTSLKKGLQNNNIECYVVYLTQLSHINTALTTNNRAKRSVPNLINHIGNEFEVKIRSVSKSTSTINKTLGDYCYLLELKLK